MPSAEQAQMLDYLTSRAAALGPAGIRARFRAAVAEFEAAVTDLTESEARRQLRDGQWSVAQIVDHLAQTTIRSAEELRHLLGGRRPPGPTVYEALTSGAAARVPWDELRDGLRAANAELDALLATTVGAEVPETATVPAILLVNRSGAGASPEPEVFAAELGWRAYALVQRLHLLDHRTQVRTLRALLER
jgi:hypothetical protein